MSRQPFLFCAGADCHERMPLPVPSPAKTSSDRPLWPTGAWSATVLHLDCGHLSVYTKQELRWQSLARKLALDRSGDDHEWRRVRLPCADPHCTVQTTVFAYLSSASSAQKLVSTIFEQPRVWRCPAGHLVNRGEAQQEEAFSLE